MMKNPPACSAGDPAHKTSVPGSGRSPGRRNGNSLIYSYLGNPMDRGALQLQSVYGVTKSQTRLSRQACAHTQLYVVFASIKESTLEIRVSL